MDLQSTVMLVVGFGLIVFIHELGHFVAAKYVGIRVEQFALGFGQALFSWRKGLGFAVGSTAQKLKALKVDHPDLDESTLGDTEYRFNWIPLGGYVKMLGQDDTKPGLVVQDPRSYTSKSVGARMVVISAGVIMNIIFAGVAFMILFMAGLKVPQAVVGDIVPMAPAQMATRADGTPAPLQVGDKILAINGVPQHNDFKKIALNTALAKPGAPLSIEVEHPDKKVETVYLMPQRIGAGSMNFVGIGISMPRLLEGPDLSNQQMREQYEKLPAKVRILGPGDRITQINSDDVQPDEYYKFDRALQQSNGRPVDLTITSADGKVRHASVSPDIESPATDEGLNFAGMLPRAMLASISEKSPLAKKAEPGDVVLAVSSAGDVQDDPSRNAFIERVHNAGEQGAKIDLKVLRGDKEIVIRDVTPSVRLETGRGLGVGVAYDQDHPVVAQTLKDSPAAAIPAGSIVRSVNGETVGSWSDVLSAFRKAVGEKGEPDKPVSVVAAGPAGGPESTYQLQLRPSDVQLIRNLRYSADIVLKDMSASRTTRNPLEAAWWGVEETRDSLQQVYLTLRRLVEGSVPVSGIMGPVGMFSVGTKVASQGLDHLLWFLAIISANLAVVNFLPIPVVDGGHFLFLLIEKIQGKPVSEKTMVVAQYIGLALILSVFVLVTYQDIIRMLTMQ